MQPLKLTDRLWNPALAPDSRVASIDLTSMEPAPPYAGAQEQVK